MDKIPTALEMWDIESKEINSVDEVNYVVPNLMIEFAKIHVEAALREASYKATVDIVDHEELSQQALQSKLLPIYGVDASSILDSYDLDLIK